MKYISTRGKSEPVDFETALLSGMAPDGGLYLPESWPEIDRAGTAHLAGLPYPDIAAEIMLPYLGNSISPDDFGRILARAYQENSFRHAAVAPLVQIGPSAWILELFHGPTIAFKDYALQLLGQIFDHVLNRRGERITIVGATSGDTGSAAIEACRGCENITIFILHPKGRVSEVQRKQMTSVKAPNVHNIAIEGDFDDCQALVKAMFADEKFRNDVNLSAVNSINWARIIAQTVYYAAASIALGVPHRAVSFAVPTGNFGNVFAAYVGRQMGLPIENLVIGTNRNDILTRFFESGEMSRAIVNPTISPSMDIQVSSNFERYLYFLLDCDSKALCAYMSDFQNKGSFRVDGSLFERTKRDFIARRCNEDETIATMRACYEETGYLIDPHTAVGLNAAMKTARDPATPIVSLACAHPAKFPDAVEKATGIRPRLPPHLADLLTRPEFLTPITNDLQRVQNFIRSKISP